MGRKQPQILGVDEPDAGDVEFHRTLRPQGPPTRPVQRASVDLRIDRPELGRGAYTVIREGDVVPASRADRARPLNGSQAGK